MLLSLFALDASDFSQRKTFLIKVQSVSEEQLNEKVRIKKRKPRVLIKAKHSSMAQGASISM